MADGHRPVSTARWATHRQPVAVRSSGTAEDLDDASFAGQQETFLFVIGNDDVVKYIKECWASLYNDRAIFYRREKHFDERSISIAVVVQCMVSAQKAGVMFTSNPITNDYDTVVLEAAWGLGEAIVSGIVTPDNLWINKHTGEVTTEYISEKETMVVRLNERGGTEGDPGARGPAGGPRADGRRAQPAGGPWPTRSRPSTKSPRTSSGPSWTGRCICSSPGPSPP